MRKSTIWLLAVVMAFAFAGLLYLQVNYVSIILKTRSEQFNETVKRSLRQVSKNLELDETRKYLEEDIKRNQIIQNWQPGRYLEGEYMKWIANKQLKAFYEELKK